MLIVNSHLLSKINVLESFEYFFRKMMKLLREYERFTSLEEGLLVSGWETEGPVVKWRKRQHLALSTDRAGSSRRCSIAIITIQETCPPPPGPTWPAPGEWRPRRRRPGGGGWSYVWWEEEAFRGQAVRHSFSKPNFGYVYCFKVSFSRVCSDSLPPCSLEWSLSVWSRLISLTISSPQTVRL